MGFPKTDGVMGFRNLQEFNVALLVKQCWRIINELDSFWVKVLKARYFPSTSFLDTIRGCRTTWAWASSLDGREILLNDAHWQIMNGSNVKIWFDRWLTSLPIGHHSPQGSVSVSRNQKVESLIDYDTRQWELEFIRPFITDHEYLAIKDTHIGDLRSMDTLVWSLVKNGLYTVQSGYHWQHNIEVLYIYFMTKIVTSCSI
ncbi:hypothetical protein ACFX2A_015403 [Malus domestica]